MGQWKDHIEIAVRVGVIVVLVSDDNVVCRCVTGHDAVGGIPVRILHVEGRLVT